MTLCPPSLGSLAENMICGIHDLKGGTYTAEGITALCEGLKGSTITSLECVAAPNLHSTCSVNAR